MAKERETGPDWVNTRERLFSRLPVPGMTQVSAFLKKYPVALKQTWIPFFKIRSERRKFILSVKDKKALLSDLMIFLFGI